MKKMIIGLILIALGITGWVYQHSQNRLPPEGIPQVVPPTQIPDGTPPSIPSGKKGVSVRGTTWVWQYAKAKEAFNLVLDSEGRFTSTTDCNSVSGSYILEGESLTFGQIASTMMYCEGSQEGVYTQALQNVSGYRVKDNNLILTLKDKSEMVFIVK